MPLYSDHISSMYYSGTPAYSSPYSYSSSVLPGSYSASYLNPGGTFSNHSSLGGYRKPIISRWVTSSGRNYAPILGTISERASGSPVRINSPRRIPLSKRSYVAPSYVPRPININTADIDVSRDKYRYKKEKTPPFVPSESPVQDNGPFMPRVDGKPETGIDSSPGEHKSTIKRGRTVVRLTTIKRKERDSPRKPQVSDPEMPEPLVAELTQPSNDDQNIAQAEPESLGWRDKLAEDLAYTDKREKKTLGAKLVEKFIVKDSGNDNSMQENKRTTDTSQSLPVPPEPKRSTSRSPDRRCSVEMLAEQANLLDSLIRNENLSTARLDLSKVGIEDESKSDIEEMSLIKRRRSSRDNALQTTKSDYSLHESLNSFRDHRDPKHFSKRRSLKKSMSGGSICRLDSIKEFTKEVIANESDLPAIDENRSSVKITKKQKPKMKAIITSSSVDISEPIKSPLKFKVDDVVVEETIEKPRIPRKEMTYIVSDEPLPELPTIPSISPKNESPVGLKRNDNLSVPTHDDNGSVSPEPDDGNFWDKIGKRETVYLMRRKQNLDEDKQKKRALYWLPENEENDNSYPKNKGDSPSDRLEDKITQHKNTIDSVPEDKIFDATAHNLGIKSANTFEDQNVDENSNNKEEESNNLRSSNLKLENNDKENKKNLVSTLKAENEILNSDKNVIKTKNFSKTLIQDHTQKIPELKTVIKTKLVRKSPDKCKSEFIATENVKNIGKAETNIFETKKTDKAYVETVNTSIINNISKEKTEDSNNKDSSSATAKVETTEIKESTEEKKSSPKKVTSTPRKGKVSPEKKKGSPKKDIKNSSDMECKCKKKSGKKIETKTSPTDKLAAKTGVKQVKAPVSKLSDSSSIKPTEDALASVDSTRVDAAPPMTKNTSTQKVVTKTKSQDDESAGPSRVKTEINEKNILKSTVSASNNVDTNKSNADDSSTDISKLIVPEPENIPSEENERKSGFVEQDTKEEDIKAENLTQKHENKGTREPPQNETVQQPKPIRKPVKEELAVRPLIATPRPLQKKVPQVIHSSSSESSTEEESSDDADESDTSEESTEFFECESNPDGRTSTGSNDSGFDSSAPTSPAGFVTLKKGGETPGPSSAPAQADTASLLERELEQSTAYGIFKKTGRFTPPARSIPRFRKYTIEDFHFIKVLGKGSFGKVLLTELRDTEYYYAVKCLKKDVVLEDDDVECTLIERKVLALGTNHPYLCHLFATFQTDSHLFFVMEYLNGGDLMFHIQQSGRFPESRARFYAAEIVSGLKFLHKRGIVYRDLKLDNILLDYEGHVRIADFGMCKLQIYLEKTADTFCGTPDYMAPEIVKGLKYNQTVDWWSFGVLLYEMLIGQSPFSGCDEDELFWSICNEMPSYPRFLSQEALTILTRLLDKDARTRLGGTDCMHGDVRDQDFFHSLSWDKLERRELEAPFKPRVRHPLDTQYFDRAFTGERPRLTAVEPQVLRSMDQEPFRGFSYTNPNATDR